jgi:hypothetical protein
VKYGPLSHRCSRIILSPTGSWSVASVLPIQMRRSRSAGPLEFSRLRRAHRVIEQTEVILPRNSRIHVDAHDLPEIVA